MRIKLLVIISVGFIKIGFGQQSPDTIYIDTEGNTTNSIDYDFMRIIEKKQDNRYLIHDYYSSGELKREYGYITKKKFLPNSDDFIEIYGTKKLKLDGVFTSYYKTGEKEEQMIFQKGRLIGDHLTFTEDGDTLYIIIEDMPLYPGGMDSLLTFVSSELKYPEQAAKENIQGRVVLQFVVNREGYVENVKVIKSVHPLLDNEAKRVVESCARWTPGKQRGKPVNVFFTFPINFTIPEHNDNQ